MVFCEKISNSLSNRVTYDYIHLIQMKLYCAGKSER